jgi:D-arabinose 1-dehydrogenase-like Zn-dependent alcohol dehydrogenase
MGAMRATVLTQFGGPEVLVPGEVELPAFRGNQMLVRVAACGVCGHDLLSRTGKFPHVCPPCVIGHEIAGTVEQVGEFITRFKPGDRVALMQRMSCGACDMCRAGRENLCRAGSGFYGEELSGGYGQYVAAGERNCMPLPPEISFQTGSILSCAIGTGLHALTRARLLPGDTVVITAASGGVGIHAVQLARLFGLRVVAITSSETKRDLLRGVGVDVVVVAAPGAGFHRQVRDLTNGDGAEAVIEISGVPTFTSSIRCLRSGGRLVAVGNVTPGEVSLNPAVPILKEIEIIGSGHAVLSDLGRAVDLVSRGLVKPQIAAVLPVEEAWKAHQLMNERAAPGRVVLVRE